MFLMRIYIYNLLVVILDLTILTLIILENARSTSSSRLVWKAMLCVLMMKTQHRTSL